MVSTQFFMCHYFSEQHFQPFCLGNLNRHEISNFLLIYFDIALLVAFILECAWVSVMWNQRPDGYANFIFKFLWDELHTKKQRCDKNSKIRMNGTFCVCFPNGNCGGYKIPQLLCYPFIFRIYILLMLGNNYMGWKYGSKITEYSLAQSSPKLKCLLKETSRGWLCTAWED